MGQKLVICVLRVFSIVNFYHYSSFLLCKLKRKISQKIFSKGDIWKMQKIYCSQISLSQILPLCWHSIDAKFWNATVLQQDYQMHFLDTFHSVRFHEIFLRLAALTKVKLVSMELNHSTILAWFFPVHKKRTYFTSPRTK